MQTVLRFLAIYCLAKRSYMGYSRKNPNKRGWGHNFWKKTPGIFRFVTTLGNPRQNEASLEIPQNCVTPIGISKVKSQDPWNSTWLLLDYLSKFHFFLYWPKEFPHSIYLVPLGKFHVLNPPVWIFFWSSPI